MAGTKTGRPRKGKNLADARANDDLGSPATGREPGTVGSPHATLNRVLNSQKSPVDMDELALAVYELLGGAKGFAGKLLLDLNDGVRSPLRSRMMDLVLRIFTRHADKNTGKEHDLASDEELEKVANDLMRKIGMDKPEYQWPQHYVI